MEAKMFLIIHKVHLYGYAHVSFPLLCLTLHLFNQQAKSMECLLSTPLTSMKQQLETTRHLESIIVSPHSHNLPT